MLTEQGTVADDAVAANINNDEWLDGQGSCSSMELLQDSAKRLNIDLVLDDDLHNVASQTNDSPAIDKVIKDTLHKQQGDTRHSTELVLQRRSQNNPYLAEITPFSEPTVVGGVTGLMIIMIDPDHKKIISTKGMGKLCGFRSDLIRQALNINLPIDQGISGG